MLTNISKPMKVIVSLIGLRLKVKIAFRQKNLMLQIANCLFPRLQKPIKKAPLKKDALIIF